MRFSPLVSRIGGKGAQAWRVHYEAEAAKKQGRDAVLLSVGDPDLQTPAAVMDRAIEALKNGDTHYTEVAGIDKLRTAIAEQSTFDGVADSADNVVVFSGAQNALFAASLCLFSVGDEVIVPEPMYVTYEATIRTSGATVVAVPCPAKGGFRPDFEAMKNAVTKNTRAILFSNPNNPSGAVLDIEELSAIAAIVQEHNLWVIADEVYCTLTFEKAHINFAALPGMAKQTITVGSLSKSLAMTGWRVGWLIAQTDLIDHVSRLALCMLYGLPGFIQQAAIVGVSHMQNEMRQMRDIYRRRRDTVLTLLQDADGISPTRPQADMFILIDVRQTGLSSLDFVETLYREEGVSLLDGGAFGDSAAGFVRLSYAVGDDDLAEGCRRLCRFVNRLRGRA